MCDNNKFNSAAFGLYLLKNNIVRSGIERFLIIWVHKFFEDRPQWPELQWYEQLPLYLEKLKEAGNQQWQITQAEQAVRIYFTNFLSVSNQGPVNCHSYPSPDI